MVEARKTAIARATEAIAAEEAGDLSSAKRLYESACSFFLHALKYDKTLSKVMKQIITDKFDECVTRAEAIKEEIAAAQSARPPRTAVSRGAGGAVLAANRDRGEPGAPTEDLAAEESGTRLHEPPATRWTDVAGLHHVKQALVDAVIVPAKLPHMFGNGHGRQSERGILLFGPPGTGKTLIASALAGESGRTFFSVSTADIMDKYVGESAKRLRNVFEEARAHRPSIIFIDEIEALCGARDSSSSTSEANQQVVSEFLRQLDGIASSMDDILLLGATNLPETLDAAMRRRFTQRVYVSLPDQSTRRRIFQTSLRNVPHTIGDADLDALADATDGYSAADIVRGVVARALQYTLHMVTEATHFCPASPPAQLAADDEARQESWWAPCSPGDPSAHETTFAELPPGRIVEPPLTHTHLERALTQVKPNVTREECAKYEAFAETYGTRLG